MEIGLEIGTIDKRVKSYNLLTVDDKQRFFDQLKIIKKQNNDCFKIVNNLEEFKESELINPWIKSEITNQELLLKLNKYASRSFNDLAQYPIFPWVIKDYNNDLLAF